jgi:RHS repeat-associated protein
MTLVKRLACLIAVTMLTLSWNGTLTAQIAPVCGSEPTCTPDTTSGSYAGVVAARGALNNVRGYSNPLMARAVHDTGPGGSLTVTVIGSQSYNYTIPILHLPGRSGLDLDLNLFYNSRVWNVDTVNASATFNADRDFPSYGFRLDFGYIERNGTSSLILTANDGTKYALAQGTDPAKPFMFYSTEGSHIQFNNSTGLLSYKDGKNVQYTAFPSNAKLLRPIAIKDRNGNSISISYVAGHDQFIDKITDTLGRVIEFNYDASNRLVSISQVLQPSGTITYVTFTWTSPYPSGYAWFNFSGLTVGATPSAAQINVLATCTYSNNTGYRFTYGDWGIIDKIEQLSSSALTRTYIKYDYPLASAGALTDAPFYVKETVSPDGADTNTSVWTYSTTKDPTTGAVTVMAVTDPNGVVSTTSLDAKTGLTSSVKVTDSSSNALNTKAYTWTTTGFPPVSTVLDNVMTTLGDSGQQSKTAYSYDPWANITDVYEYDYGLTLSRHTVTTYGTVGDYVTLHIVNLPTEVVIKDGAGNTVSRTDMAYDASTPTAVTGASAHDDTGFGASFNTRGNLTSLTRYLNPSAGTGGLTRTFSYDTLGNVVSAQLDCCNQKTFTFSSATQYSLPDSVVRGPSGGTQFTTSYTYDATNSRVLTVADENSQRTSYQYDSVGRQTQIAFPQSGTALQLNTAYGDDTAAPTVTDSNTGNSVVKVTTLDGLAHVMEVDSRDGTKTVASVKYAYDKLWQRTQTSNPFAPGDTQLNNKIVYDASGRITQVSPPSGGSFQYQYSGNTVTFSDPAGKQRKKYVDAFGRLTQIDEPGGGAPATTATGSFTINGTLNSWTDTSHPATSAHVELTFMGSLQSKASCSPSGQSCSDSGTISITVGGFTKSAAYSALTGTDSSQPVHALANAFHADASSPVDATYFGADESGNIVMDFTARQTGAATNYPLSISILSVNSNNFPTASFMVSAGSSLIGGMDASSGGTVFDSGVVYVAVTSPSGTIVSASAPYSHSGNNTAAMIASALVAASPNGLNQPGAPYVATASGATVTLTYNSPGSAGNLLNMSVDSSTANPDSPSFFSPGGVMSGGADPLGPKFSSPVSTFYTYDVFDNLVQVTEGAQTRKYLYDAISRITTITTPESGTVSTFYTDNNGNVCSSDPSLPCRVQDARGITKTFTYDAINRPTGLSYSDGSTPAVSYKYDAGGSAAFALGRLTTQADSTTSEAFTYDNLGRITAVKYVIDGQSYSLHYAYNAVNQVTSITYPTGRVVTQQVDSAGRLSSISDAAATYLSAPTFNAGGQPLGLTLGNGVQAAFAYNDHMQLSGLRYYKTGTTSDILNLGYDYTTGVPGNNGQVQAIHFYTSPGVEDATKSEYFNYDALGRLSSANTGIVSSTVGTWSSEWGYDRYGNRLSQTLTGGNLSAYQPNLLVDPATNRIMSPGYQYDASGNMTSDGFNNYSYDAANRLVQINGGKAAYTYFGPFRIKKLTGTDSTVYIYDGDKPVVEYLNGTVSRENVYAGSQLLATIAAGATTYHHPDHLSDRAESNASGAITRTFGHLPFGDAWYETGTPDKIKFTTYESDNLSGETGLNYALFRHQSPTLARFISADLLGGNPEFPQSLNRYSYVANDPVNLVDPSGLLAQCADGTHAVKDPTDGTLVACIPNDVILVQPSFIFQPGGMRTFLCNPKVLAAITKAFTQSILANHVGFGNAGNSQKEAGFTVNPDNLTGSDPIPIQGGAGSEANGRLTLRVDRGVTLGLFHTHQSGNGMPSTPKNNVSGDSNGGDSLMAVLHDTDVYVISNNGLAVAPKNSTNPADGQGSTFIIKAPNLSDALKALSLICGG